MMLKATRSVPAARIVAGRLYPNNSGEASTIIVGKRAEILVQISGWKLVKGEGRLRWIEV